MPSSRPYSITASSTSISVKRDRGSEITLTITNQTDKSIRTEARLALLSDLPDNCIRFQGDPILEIPAGQSIQIGVTIEVPAQVAAGSYSFRVDAIGVNRPEEDFAEGPTLSVSVEQEAVVDVPEKKFKWWYAAIAASAVLLVVVISMDWGSGKKPEPDPVIAIPEGVFGEKFGIAQVRLEQAGFATVLADEPVPVVGKQNGEVIGLASDGNRLSEKSTLKKGATVEIIFAVEGVQVPNSAGKKAKEIATILTDSKLVVQGFVGEESSPPKPVVRLSPKSGTIVAKWTPVSVIIKERGKRFSIHEYKANVEALNLANFTKQFGEFNKSIVPRKTTTFTNGKGVQSFVLDNTKVKEESEKLEAANVQLKKMSTELDSMEKKLLESRNEARADLLRRKQELPTSTK